MTPEELARHHARRCRGRRGATDSTGGGKKGGGRGRGGVVIDAFCGAGGNAIQLALVCERVSFDTIVGLF